MANRVFFTLAIVSLAITSVFSYGYPGYPTRDSNIRQTRRCPHCPADCPESLSSPWYGSPTVYGQPISITPNNRNFAQQSSSFTGHQNYRRDAPNSRPRYNAPTLINANTYANPLSVELDSYDDSYNNFRCPYANCNARSARRSEDISSTHEVEDMNPTLGFVEPRGFPDELVTSPSYSLQPFRELAKIFQTSLEHQNQGRRISRHYGSYKNPEIGNSYEKSPSFNYEDRIKAIETPSQEKVYVVYRADADRSMDEEELKTLPMISARQQQSIQASHDERSSPMSDSQLEEVVRRAIAAATKQNMREAALYRNPVDALRGIDYNEHQREGDEILYNPRRPYNDELYRRFNPDAPIDWQEISKTTYDPSEVSYATGESFYPDEEYFDTNIPIVSREEEMIPEDNNQEDNPVENVEYDVQPEVTGWEENTESTEDVEKKSNDSDSEEKKLATINEESKETDKSKEEKASDAIEVKIPLTNYRTHSRLDAESSKSEEEEAKIEKSSTLPSVMKNYEAERMLKEANPDFVDEMENPLTATESTLRLNFETLEASTPSPID